MSKVISVILPVYNGIPYLKDSVESVLKQNFQDFEFIILDDCSTDGSYEYLKNLDDPRVKLLRNEKNKGLFPNLNMLINASDTALIKIWSQDDIMYPDCLETFVKFHAQHEVGFSYCSRDKIDENGQLKPALPADHTPSLISTSLHTRIAYFTGSIAGNIANVCLNRKALHETGLFDERMKISGDFFMWVKLAEKFNTGFINKYLLQLRDHSGQLSRKESYYKFHIIEDMIVYRYLDGYAGEKEKKEGHANLLQYKMLFYFTVMMKAFAKADFDTAFGIRKALATYISVPRLALNFVKYKLLKQKRKPFVI